MISFRTAGAIAVMLVFLTAMAMPASAATSFSNLINPGSVLDANGGSLSTSLSASPGGLNSYSVGLQGIGGSPAIGSISAYAHGNIMEGGANGGLAQQLLFSQKTTASGEITHFSFSFSYLSKLTS
jgi:hypothetical protein